MMAYYMTSTCFSYESIWKIHTRFFYHTNIYVFVCQMDIALNHNIAMEHWWDMPSLQQEGTVIQSL